jgi:hypothetical protein
MKQYLNKLVTLEFSDLKNSYSGFLLDFSDEWILLRNNPVDYIIDGFIILRNKNLESIIYDENNEFTEKVIRLKKVKLINDFILPLSNLETILSFLNKKYGIFQLATKRESAVYLGRLIEITESQVFIQFLNTKGIFDGEIDFKREKIRIIAFNTDYVNSLKAYSDSILFQ